MIEWRKGGMAERRKKPRVLTERMVERWKGGKIHKSLKSESRNAAEWRKNHPIPKRRNDEKSPEILKVDKEKIIRKHNKGMYNYKAIQFRDKRRTINQTSSS